LGLRCLIPTDVDKPFVAILRHDYDHLEGSSSSSSIGVKSYYNVPRYRPAASSDTQLGLILKFLECALWIQSLHLYACQRCAALQSSAMDEFAEYCFRHRNSSFHREGSRYRRYFEPSPLYTLIFISNDFSELSRCEEANVIQSWLLLRLHTLHHEVNGHH
jgi:hypothetical protein